jgi:hypothetical protein
MQQELCSEESGWVREGSRERESFVGCDVTPSRTPCLPGSADRFLFELFSWGER